MEEASISVSQDQFICPVCLELLKDPVTVPCGHSYCKVCINGCWDQEDQSGVYSCPQCRQTFTPRPVLRRNNMLDEVVGKLKKKTELQAASADHCYSGAADVECDFCTETKFKAVKSCLVCLASFCETHIKPHYQSSAFKKHKLVEASSKLQEKICSKHDKIMEIYCRTDQMCVCSSCVDEHKGHDMASADSESTKKKSELKEVQRKCEQRLQETKKKVEEVKQAVITIKRSAQTAVEDSERIFTELISSMEKKRSEVTELIRDQEKAELSRAEGLLEQLEQEIADLNRRDAELQQVSHTQDHIHFLQSFQSLCVSSGSEDSSSIYINQRPSFDGVRRSLTGLKERLEEFCREEFNIIPPAAQIILPSEPKSREEFLLYNSHLTLDPNTAHHKLRLYEKNSVVRHTERQQSYSDHPERFVHWCNVLCKESVCGRCYWELEWSGENGVNVSVSYKEISRKGGGHECRFGFNNKSWRLNCSSSLSFYHNKIETKISASPSSRIGVYVDHSAGTLSFYSVSDTMMLLHRVHTTFTQPLYAGFGFNPGTSVRLCDPE